MNQADPREWLAAFAPVVGEAERSRWVYQQLQQAGYAPQQDDLGNVWVGEGSILWVAHLDTVLSPTPIRVQGDRWLSPAVGDNSAGVAVLLSLLPQLLAANGTAAFSVGEEGLGNLRGARALVAALKPSTVIAIDGYLPGLVLQSVGSVRLRAKFTGPGGHAWGDRGRKSPMPALGQALVELSALERPATTSLNVGRVWGGHAINAIPQEAGLDVDLRSSEAAHLAQLEADARQIFLAAAGRAGLPLDLEVLGRRAAGQTVTPQLHQAALAALAAQGLTAQLTPGSTDAAAAVEVGIPAITVGVYQGGGAHTPEEWVDPQSLLQGRQVLLELVKHL